MFVNSNMRDVQPVLHPLQEIILLGSRDYVLVDYCLPSGPVWFVSGLHLLLILALLKEFYSRPGYPELTLPTLTVTNTCTSKINANLIWNSQQKTTQWIFRCNSYASFYCNV